VTAPWPNRTADTPEQQPVAVPRYSRRLSDKILIAFRAACEQREIEVATQLLKVLEMMFERPREPGDRRRNAVSLVAANMLLWPLRHPDPADHRGQPPDAINPPVVPNLGQ
jgi:hypothetical protein